MFTLQDIADALGRPVEGDGTLTLRRAAEPSAAGPEDLALAMSPSYADALARGAARAAILWEGADWQAMGLAGAVTVPRARLAMARITAALDPGPELAPGIHPSAIVDPTAEIAPDAAIGPLCVVGPRVRIGAGTRLLAHVTVGADARIGENCLLHPGVRVGSRVTLGDRVICQPGATIGGDGFSFVTPEESGVEKARRSLGATGEVAPQSWTRIHSLGSVTIGDDVEIGSNATIDKGTVADTRVGRGTKIDNLVQIGHNNIIGEDCLLCGQVGLAGSSVVGDRVVLGGQVGVNDNITIGDDVVAGGASKIFTRVPSGAVILGHPAVKMETQIQIQKATRRLPRLAAQIAELRAAVAKLTGGDGA
ncbi:UDP-3-O-(3-hydroxymyristoyl)glucosamine N-acyltransferase [Jannaschia seohaensis]|uniref:UDP-3-O-acylglucosamine N-acyltransferase n=1 Tax=Jannaschia seohaensis TaxID=475081 RepID=A0A2Y9AJX2_9RHOB|nr:UDP-3-O-(3-hydroxymyristoyl)glucosamine N-acyltransferase [Jannaschia seohaensis]PWJ20382.1 UDP-3-O-[3-hydroxymyristoyl] glucosamine N-acyltransferase [Jannaschia seohaensis]SSA44445.1 UDP-3-O-[3-hydroxymyristoyl] glucosamine N-acyltransferase [Jannaschia seohaensis]